MGKFIDLIGQKFGRLTPIKYVGKNKHSKSLYLCKCDCYKEKIVLGNSLVSGRTKSCGCLRIKHGYSKRNNYSKTYKAWRSMLGRCNNPKVSNYKNYGGRDNPITVCDRWDINKGGSFENFLEDMGECPKGLSLDRINNDGSYEPNNCRWATNKEQANNKRKYKPRIKKNEK